MIAALIFICHFAFAQGPADWRLGARHLTGAGTGEAARHAARLRADPDLDTKLRAALGGPDRFLAMDVITALKRRALLPDLVRASATDHTGYFYLAILAFVDRTNSAEFGRLFLERWAASQTPPGARVILLDTLSRMRVAVPSRQIADALDEDSPPEVRQAAMAYLHRAIKRQPQPEDLQILREQLRSSEHSRQRRLQLLFILADLKPELRRSLGAPAFDCPTDTPPRLKKLCQGVRH